MEIREFTDTIIGTLRRTTPIRYVSRRHVYNIAKSHLVTLLNQQRSEYSLGDLSNIITYSDCLEMEEVDPVICGVPELRRCGKLYRSKCKLKGMLYNKNGASIISVSTIDYMDMSSPTTYFKKTTPSKYNTESNRYGFSSKRNKYYFIKDEYLYIINERYKSVSVSYITTESFNGCSCDFDPCKPYYEYDMPITDKIMEAVVMATQQELGIQLSIPSGKSEKE